MARCGRKGCGRWRPELLVIMGHAGLYLDGVWYCSAACLEAAVRQRLDDARHVPPLHLPGIPPLKLGVLLIHQGAVTPAMVKRALEEQKATRLRLGAQLQRMGLVASSDVLRALAAQAGVSYLTSVDCTCAYSAPGDLPRDAVRALGLVPFEADAGAQLLKVACTAPVPRLAVAAMRQLTGWAVEPYLVADDQWTGLAAAYGLERQALGGEAANPRDVRAAAARVARAAEHEGRIWMQHARCDAHMWVRLQGGDRVEDLLLSVAE